MIWNSNESIHHFALNRFLLSMLSFWFGSFGICILLFGENKHIFNAKSGDAKDSLQCYCSNKKWWKFRSGFWSFGVLASLRIGLLFSVIIIKMKNKPKMNLKSSNNNLFVCDDLMSFFWVCSSSFLSTFDLNSKIDKVETMRGWVSVCSINHSIPFIECLFKFRFSSKSTTNTDFMIYLSFPW